MDDPPPTYEEATGTSAAPPYCSCVVTTNRSAPQFTTTTIPIPVQSTLISQQTRQQPPYRIVVNLDQSSNRRTSESNIWLFLKPNTNCQKCLRGFFTYVAIIIVFFIIGTIVQNFV